MRFLPISLLLFIPPIVRAQAPAKPADESLTLADVVSLSKVATEDTVIARVKRNGKPFDLNADEVVELKKSGVSDLVIKYLVDPALPYQPTPPAPPTPPPAPAVAAPAGPAPAASPPPPPPPPAPKPKPITDPVAAKLPPDPGIYSFAGGDQFSPLARKTILPYKQPGKVGAALSAGLIKGHFIGSVVGASAGSRFRSAPLVLYLRLPEGAMIDDFVLLRLDRAKDRRDLDFGTKQGKELFPVDSVKPFSSKEVGPALYRLTVPALKPGEYFFFIRGTGNDKKGLMGEGYELGVN